MKPTMKFALKPLQQSLLLGVLTLSMTGCQMLGDLYSRPAPQLPEKYDTANAGMSQAAQQVALQQWWTLFNDSQLNQLVDTALVKNNNVQLAVARIEEADAQMREIGGNLLPTVTATGSGLRNRVTQSGVFPVFGNNPRKTYKIGLNGSYELDLWGKLRRANEAARAQLLSTQYAKEAVTWSLSSLVANNYLNIRSLDAQLRVNEENLKTAQDSLDLAKRRVEGGVATVLDAHQAELVVTTLQTQIVDLKRLRALSEHQLGLLTNNLGLKIAPGDLMAIPTPPVVPTGLPSELMEARPDVRQAEQDMVSANANIAGSGKALAYAIARQESAFNPAAVSPADARGLLQLLPSTAKGVAARHGIAYAPEKLTRDAGFNATLGAHYLGEQIDAFGGSYILTFIAYNAGPRKVPEWIERYGDPRGKSIDEVVDWIERIPFPETRNYVMRVMENYQVYKSRLGQKTDIVHDLRFGR